MRRAAQPIARDSGDFGHRFTRRELLTLRTYPRVRERSLRTTGVAAVRCGFCGGAHTLDECPRAAGTSFLPRVRRKPSAAETPTPTTEAHGHD